MGRAPPAQAGSIAPRPASSTAASDESIESGTLDAGPTAFTSQTIAASRPSTSWSISSTLRSRYAAPPSIWRCAIQATYVAAVSASGPPARPARTAAITCLMRWLTRNSLLSVIESGNGMYASPPSSVGKRTAGRPSGVWPPRAPSRLTTRLQWMFSPMMMNGAPAPSSPFMSPLPRPMLVAATDGRG